MGVNIDWFSLLHDSLLSVIVSSLPFKDAVRTSTLSKDWKKVCKLTRNIEFNELFFVKFDQPPEIVHAQRMAFLEFMKKWIENHGENVIDKFSLTMSAPKVFSEDIDRCITFAIRNGVKDLELDFTSPTWIKDKFYYNNFVASVDLNSYVYEYSGLESLKLYSCDFSASEMVNFHSLKEISLGFMKVSISAIEALLTNCEMLESLNFYMCWSLDEDFILKGEYLGLKKLVINKCHFKSSTFRINAPNLKVFDYHGSLFDIDIQSPALDEVNLEFSLEHGCQGHGSYYLHKLLKDLPSPRVMTVCSYWLQKISIRGSKRTRRNMKVKHLIMKTSLHQFEFEGITFMLNSCPNLEHLTIEIVEKKYMNMFEPVFPIIPEKYWIDTIKAYKCVKSHLKKVEIKNFKGTKNELSVITYFLLRGETLRKMSINLLKADVKGEVGSNDSARREAARSLLTIPKASTNLELLIC